MPAEGMLAAVAFGVLFTVWVVLPGRLQRRIDKE